MHLSSSYYISLTRYPPDRGGGGGNLGVVVAVGVRIQFCCHCVHLSSAYETLTTRVGRGGREVGEMRVKVAEI